jgi:hypothetical protein
MKQAGDSLIDSAHIGPLPPGPLSDPFDGWGNDDLLLNQAARDAAIRADPKAFRALDWPELRELFSKHDTQAKALKQSSRYTGISIALLVGFGAAILALTPILPSSSQKFVTFIGLFSTMIGVVAGFWHWILSSTKRNWLVNRLWAERARQLYFQIILNNLDVAARAMSDDDALAAWKELRAKILDTFIYDFTKMLHFQISAVYEDRGLKNVWLDRDWRMPRKIWPTRVNITDEMRSNVANLLKRLEQQRVQIQIRYAEGKLQASAASPQTRAKLLGAAGDLMTVTVALIALWAGMQVMAGADPTVALAAGAAAGALGLLARALEHGLRAKADAELFSWYLASVKSIEARFAGGVEAEQIQALRELEVHSYHEMRQYLLSHRDEKYV